MSTDWLSIWLQEELKKRALDAKWTPLKGKKELVDRLQVLSGPPFASGCVLRALLMCLHPEHLCVSQAGSPTPWHFRTLESAPTCICAAATLQAWVNTAREEWKVVNGRNEKLQAAEAVHEAAKKRAKDAVRLATSTRHLALAWSSRAICHRP